MASLNKVLLMGNLTRTPELRYTPSGQAVCDLGLAVNRKYSVNGQDREDVCFIDIVVWAKQAESCSKYLQKGSPVFIEGRLHNDTWEDKDGKKKSRMRVTAERVQFLSSKSDGQSYRREDNNTKSSSENSYYQSPSHQNSTVQNSDRFAPTASQTVQQDQPKEQSKPMPPPEVFDNNNNTAEPEDDIPF